MRIFGWLSVAVAAVGLPISLALAQHDADQPGTAAAPPASGLIDIGAGSGSFVMAGGSGHEHKTIRVYYHRPRDFGTTSPILIVLAGSGRNADVYRDSWVRASERHSVLVLAPTYAEPDYDPSEYNFGGVIRNIRMQNLLPGSSQRVYRLRDEDVSFDISHSPEEWLFNDFDRLFGLAVQATGSAQDGYDLFGHSAGGQLLHRFALFQATSSARRIVAANSGFYTLPRLDLELPFGLGASGSDEPALRRALQRNLTVFLGELDDENETRGTHLHTPMADAQGIGRLARGRTFYREGQAVAAAMGAEFNWKLVVNPGVGHDQEAMGTLAAAYLYGDSTAH